MSGKLVFKRAIDYLFRPPLYRAQSRVTSVRGLARLAEQRSTRSVANQEFFRRVLAREIDPRQLIDEPGLSNALLNSHERHRLASALLPAVKPFWGAIVPIVGQKIKLLPEGLLNGPRGDMYFTKALVRTIERRSEYGYDFEHLRWAHKLLGDEVFGPMDLEQLNPGLLVAYNSLARLTGDQLGNMFSLVKLEITLETYGVFSEKDPELHTIPTR
jgi:hypothetical protein